MFGFLRKPSSRQAHIMAEYSIKRDLLLAERALEDARVLADRRRQDWAMQADYDKAMDVAEGNFDD